MKSGASGLAWLAVIVTGCFTVSLAGADEPAPAGGVQSLVDAIRLDTSLRGAYWTSARTLDDREDLPTAALWLRGRWDLGSSAALVVDGFVRNDDLFHARDTNGKFREGYLDARAGPLDVRIGKQIIAWGRADRINPTDNLTPRDFTRLVPEDADQRSGTTGVRATYDLMGTALTGVVLPTFEPHVIPLRRPPVSSAVRERVPHDPVLQGALKIERVGGRVDWSLSYFDGIDLFPDLQIDRIHASGLDLVLRHHRIRVVGADAAAAIGPYTVRGEGAYTFTEHVRRGDQIKSPFFFLVLGADRTLPGALYVNVQYLLRVIADFQDPDRIGNAIQRSVAIEQALINDQLDPVKHAVAVRVSRNWLNDTLASELAFVVSPNRGDYAVRPKISYAVTDHVKITAGGQLFRGDTVSVFGRLRDASTAYVEVRWDL